MNRDLNEEKGSANLAEPFVQASAKLAEVGNKKGF